MSFVPQPCESISLGSVEISGGTVEITNDVGTPVPVSGTVEITNDVGTPVPVSGTVEITNDVGTPVPVSGTVEITNDVGNPVPVSGTIEITNDAGAPITVSGTVVSASGKLEDTPHVTGDAGTFILGVRNTGAAALTDTDGDYSPIAVDSAGRLMLSAGLTGPAKAEDAAHASGDSGVFVLAVRNDNGVTSFTTTDGDYSPIATDIKGRAFTTTSGGTLNNGVETAVSSAAVQVVAAATNRKGLIIQNNGTGDVRIGTTGVTATTGVKLLPGDSLLLTGGATPTNAVFAIRSAAVDSIVLAQELI